MTARFAVALAALSMLAGTALAQPPGGPGAAQPPVHMNSATPQGAASTGPVLVASGSGRVERDPDRAVLMLGATTMDPSPAAAQEKLNQIMQRALAAVRAVDAADLEVQTGSVSLHVEYEMFQRGEDGGQPKVAGYRATNILRITTKDPKRVGALLDAGIKSGANQVQGIWFELADAAAARQEAIRLAALDARAKAGAMAGALGLTVGPVLEAHTGVDARGPVHPFAAGMEMARMAKADLTPTPVETGKITVTAEVVVKFAAR